MIEKNRFKHSRCSALVTIAHSSFFKDKIAIFAMRISAIGFFEGHCQASISGRGEREGFCGRVLAFSPLPFSQEDHYNRCKDGFNREAEVMKGESKTYPGGDFKLKSEGQGPGMDSFGSPFPALAISWGMGHV
jgi:hypothetical protein